MDATVRECPGQDHFRQFQQPLHRCPRLRDAVAQRLAVHNHLRRAERFEFVHARYKDLALVEWAFRTSKTVQLEMRPVHVRLASRTRGHALVIMLAYKIVQELARRWQAIDATVQEGLDELKTLCTTQMVMKGKPLCNCIPPATGIGAAVAGTGGSDPAPSTPAPWRPCSHQKEAA